MPEVDLQDSFPCERSAAYDNSVKIILIGDAGVGKTSLIASYLYYSIETPQSTNDMDLKFKLLTVGDTELMLKIWDTGQVQNINRVFFIEVPTGIILVYDITDRSSFTAISDFWAKEVGLHTNNPDCVKMLVGNKVDRNSERAVSREEGLGLARTLQSLFFESSAKTRENVKECFETLALQIMEVPSHEEEESPEQINPMDLIMELSGVGGLVDVLGGIGGGGGGGRSRGRGRGCGRGHSFRGGGRGICVPRVPRAPVVRAVPSRC